MKTRVITILRIIQIKIVNRVEVWSFWEAQKIWSAP